MEFLADKVWQGGGQSSVDMNFVAQQYNSNGMSLYDEKDREKIFDNEFDGQNGRHLVSESIQEDPEYANALKDSYSTVKN